MQISDDLPQIDIQDVDSEISVKPTSITKSNSQQTKKEDS